MKYRHKGGLPDVRALLIAVGAASCLSACSQIVRDSNTAPPASAPDFTLQLLHMADMDGTTGALNNVDGFSALVDHFRDEFPDNTLFVSSGDNYIPGPRYFAASAGSLESLLGVPGNGRGDIALLNAMGLQVSAVGNHDLDSGTEAFAELLSQEQAEEGGGVWPGAAFPYLSANIDFSADEAMAALETDPGAPVASSAGRVAASATVQVNGETIGLVGASTPLLAAITSTGSLKISPVSNELDELAAIVQESVNTLTNDGVNKIILLSHMQQLDIERTLETRLNNVDVIVAGGSNTLLADDDDILRTGDEAADSYPLRLQSSSGEPVLIVNVDADYRYLGRLVLPFDAEGRIITDGLNESVNGVYSSTDNQLASLGASAIPEVAELSDALRSVLIERDGNILGRSAVYLDGRRSKVRTEETNLGNLTADANLWLARQADPTVAASLKNGGGIRSDIGDIIQPPGTVDASDVEFLPPTENPVANKAAGDVSQFDIEGSLGFNNGLTLLTLTAGELKEVLEHAVAASGDGATPGQFPQVAGLQFTLDTSRAARDGSDTSGDHSTPGERVRSLELVDDNGGVSDVIVREGELIGDSTRPIRIVILDFIAKCVDAPDESCGDGYPLKGLDAPARVDLTERGTDPGKSDFADAGSEQDALAEYLLVFYADEPFALSETPASEDKRIQNITQR